MLTKRFELSEWKCHAQINEGAVFVPSDTVKVYPKRHVHLLVDRLYWW